MVDLRSLKISGEIERSNLYKNLSKIFSLSVVQSLATRNLNGLSLTVIYRKVTSSNSSLLEAYAGFFRLLMKVIFDPYVR